MIIFGPPVAKFVSAQTGHFFRTPHQAIGFERDGKIRAGIVFQNWSGVDIDLTVAGTEIPRSLLTAAWNYVVMNLGCRRATFRTPADNWPAIKAMARLGARLEGQQRKFYGGRDALLFGILAEEFPYGRY